MQNGSQWISSLKIWKIIHYKCHNNINKHRGYKLQIQHSLRKGGGWCGMRMWRGTQKTPIASVIFFKKEKKVWKNYGKLVSIVPTESIWMTVILLPKHFCMLEVFYFKINVKNAFILIHINKTKNVFYPFNFLFWELVRC